MGPIGHLRRGFSAAYQNIGIGIIFCLISFFAASATVGFILPITESWGALFMAAVLAGKKADWDTFQEILNRRTVDILIFGLVSFLIMGVISFLFVIVLLIPVIGLPIFLGSSAGGQLELTVGLMIGAGVGLFFLILFFIALYCFLRLVFTPHILYQTDLSFNDSMKKSWQETKEYGLLKIYFTLLFAWIFGFAGFLLCGIGVLLTWPVVYGALGSLYHDALGEKSDELLCDEEISESTLEP